MKLRIFYRKSVLAHAMQGKRQYDHSQHSEDFPAGTVPHEAFDKLYAKFGRVDPQRDIAPSQYITINSHTMVDETREIVRLPEERVQEQDLFDGLTMKACLQDAPNMKKRKRK